MVNPHSTVDAVLWGFFLESEGIMWWIIYSVAGSGVVKRSAEAIEKLRAKRWIRDIRGPFASDFEAYLVLRGVIHA